MAWCLLPVVEGVAFEVNAGECSVLGGPSGAGKSSLLKMVYGNYGVDGGAIRLWHRHEWVDLATATPRRHRTAPRHHRLCQPVPPHRAARLHS